MNVTMTMDFCNSARCTEHGVRADREKIWGQCHRQNFRAPSQGYFYVAAYFFILRPTEVQHEQT